MINANVATIPDHAMNYYYDTIFLVEMITDYFLLLDPKPFGKGQEATHVVRKEQIKFLIMTLLPNFESRNSTFKELAGIVYY